MTTALRTLIIDDEPDAAELEVAALEREGFEVEWRRVATRTGIVDALAVQEWDVVLCDLVMPGLESSEAFELVRNASSSPPVVLVSGRIGEEAAVESMREGASDYVSKDNLARLGLVIRRTLREAEANRRREAAEVALRANEVRFRTVVESAPEAMVIVDEHGRIVLINARAQALFGYRREELLGQPIEILVPSSSRAQHAKHRFAYVAAPRARPMDSDLELFGRRSDGSEFPAEISLSPLETEEGLLVASSIRDVTESRRIEQGLRFFAHHDALTGLLNRRRFDEELARQVAEAARYPNVHAALLLVDLDNLKYVNDTLGHKAGDELIKQAARVMHDRLREGDVLARLGGDEFGVLLPHTELVQAQLVAESLCEALRDSETTITERPMRTTASIGVAAVGGNLSAEESLTAADVAMYDAKSEGRGRVSVRQPQAERAPLRQALSWSGRITNALECNRFALYAQPIVDVATGELSRQELLLRMRAEDGEMIMPSAFIHPAERFGLIGAIDRWVVRGAIRLLAEAPREPACCVNLSRLSIGDPEFVSFVGAEISSWKIDPARIVFEIAEATVIHDLDAAIRFILELAEVGCASALDNFGSGFGSFSYLKYLPVGYVKIDREFVCRLTGNKSDESNRVVVRAIIDVAHSLGKQTVAEHVPDQDAMSLLAQYGSDYAQGFFLGKPEPISADAQIPSSNGTAPTAHSTGPLDSTHV